MMVNRLMLKESVKIVINITQYLFMKISFDGKLVKKKSQI